MLNSDGSSTQRIVGSYLYSLNILEQRPFLGSGLGSDNLTLINKVKNFYSIDYQAYYPQHFVPIIYSNTTFFSNLIGSGGILSLLFFYCLIISYFLLNKNTRLFALVLIVLGFASGGFLDLQTWISFSICIAIQERNYQKANY